MRICVSSNSTPEEMQQAFLEFYRTRDPALRAQLVDAHLNLVRYIAQKYSRSGEPIEDLIQVGEIGLINAVDRFKPKSGNKFSTFATPTIAGEIKRHFRDKTWSLKVPRRLQELSLQIKKELDRSDHELSPEDLVSLVGRPIDEVLEAIDVAVAHETVSIDTIVHSEGNQQVTLTELLGKDDPYMLAKDNEMTVDRLTKALSPRLRLIIGFRFIKELSQTDVAYILGLSQMHVSRLQCKALKIMRCVSRNQPPPIDNDGEIDIKAAHKRYLDVMERIRSLKRKRQEEKEKMNRGDVAISLTRLRILIAFRPLLPADGEPDLVSLTNITGTSNHQLKNELNWLRHNGFITWHEGVCLAGHCETKVNLPTKEIRLTNGVNITNGQTVNLDKLCIDYVNHGGRLATFRGRKPSISEKAEKETTREVQKDQPDGLENTQIGEKEKSMGTQGVVEDAVQQEEGKQLQLSDKLISGRKLRILMMLLPSLPATGIPDYKAMAEHLGIRESQVNPHVTLLKNDGFLKCEGKSYQVGLDQARVNLEKKTAKQVSSWLKVLVSNRVKSFDCQPWLLAM